jgi:GTPase SAR1 family protein
MWMNEIKTHAPENVTRILVGNKSDREEYRQVSTDDGKELAQKYNVNFLETSAKECIHIEEAFTLMIREINSRAAATC